MLGTLTKIVISGGHLTPALAVIPRLREKGWQVFFFGRKTAIEGDPTTSVEYQLIKEMGIPFYGLTSGRLQRKFTIYTLSSLLKIPLGFFQSLYYLIRIRPQLVLSFGGYLALPVAAAAWLLGMPVVTHEQSVVPGLATKIIGRWAKKICLSWKETENYFPYKTILTGNPLRPEIFYQGEKPESITISEEKLPLIYITGGSLGSNAINEVIGQILSELVDHFRIVHQSGQSKFFDDISKLSRAFSLLPPEKRSRYFLTKYLKAIEVGWVLNKADLVIGRAGANTVAELVALQKKAILIPLPWAGQKEQQENALQIEKMGLAKILPQEELTGPRLLSTIYSMMEKGGKPLGSKKVPVKEDAAANLVKVVNEVLNVSPPEKKYH
jgi:UDP-N-acetylglucosamine--N-acetylmuramyl-(pentapeptide) pyrophosphoryl-undecaprenol N-acetylglucosamine transferase